MSDDNHRIDREDCYICSRGNPDILERHHIVPKQFGGSDAEANLVDLCPSCHRAIESLYDERFWGKVGAISEEKQLDHIAIDLIERLEQLEIGLSTEISSTQEKLEEDYANVDIDVAKANAREKYLDQVSRENDWKASSETSDTDRVAEFINDCSTENIAPSVDDVVEHMAHNGSMSESEVRDAVHTLQKCGRAYETSDGSIRVIDE